MTLAQTERLLKLLRASGVSYFKSEDLEIRMEAVESPTPEADSAVLIPPVVPRGTRPLTVKNQVDPVVAALQKQNVKQDNAGDIKVKVAQVPHKINEMISVLKMSPEQLLDTVFPEGATALPSMQAGGE